MEASIMDGATRRAGAAQLLRRVRNPVRLARAVMEKTPHVTLAGEAAEQFALEQGLPFEPEAYFFTPFRYQAMLKLRAKNEIALSEDTVVKAASSDGDACGTVGAVALDSSGNLAAATSSGGTANKYAGRIGQASVVGAGVYAHNPTCAVSCTGHGEAFMRVVAAHNLSALIEYAEMDVTAAADTVVYRRLEAIQGRGGLIALDRRGQIAAPFNTEGMYRAWLDVEGGVHTAIYKPVKAWPIS
jgi:beta-aspartyl-peptidase (threonine type)